MTETRKFAQHILPTSHHSRNKNVENDKTDYSIYSLKWGSCIPEPVDYEKYLSKNKGSILNDPHRELIIFPYDDLKCIRLLRLHRVPNAGVPPEALQPDAFGSNALARHCISFFANQEWTCMYQPSQVYRGHFCKLPRSSMLDVLMGPLIHHWFVTDQTQHDDSGTDLATTSGPKLSPAHNLAQSCSGSSRPWTTAVLAARTRHSTIPDSAPNGSMPNADQNCSDTALCKRSHVTGNEPSKMSSDRMTNGHDDEGEPGRGDLWGSESMQLLKLDTYVECSLTVCTRVEYTVCLRVRESLLASGQDVRTNQRPSTAPHGIALEPYCFRAIQPDELSQSTSTRTVTDATTGVAAEQRLHTGLFVIAPVGWQASQPLSSNVILLDSVNTVHPIGDNWLKLDRTGVTSQSKDSLGSTELFVYFDNSVGGPSTRQTWLDLIRAVIDQNARPPPATFHLGSIETNHGLSNGGVLTTDNEVNQPSQLCADAASVRGALQRFAQETEFFISHQRQKGRIKLITVYPEVRFAYDKTAAVAQDRARSKSTWSSATSVERPQNPTCVVVDSRGARGLSSVGRQTSCDSASSTSVPPPLPFPDRTVHLCSRRFLATCLRLHSRMQCTLDTTMHSSGPQENPEPYFCTMYLINTAEGRRVSEEFYWNPNSSAVDAMIPAELFRHMAWSQVVNDSESNQPDVGSSRNTTGQRLSRGPAPPPPSLSKLITPLGMGVSIGLDGLRQCRSALFSVPANTVNLEHIYLVVRVDKVLNGTISAAVEKYTKGVTSTGQPVTTDNNKVAWLMNRSMAVYCRHLGRYRMPFAWGARSLASRSHKVPLFKVDSSRVSESSFVQLIQSLARLVDSTPSSSHRNGCSPEHVFSVVAADLYGRNADPALDMVERTLKTQLLPIQLDVAVSELINQSSDPSVQRITGLVTPDLLPVNTDKLVEDNKYLIPPTHPTLKSNELVREVEHLFDIRSVPVAGVPYGSDSGCGSSLSTGDPELAILTGHSGSLQRPSQPTVPLGSRSNRDSVISCTSTGSGSPALDTWAAATSVVAVRSRNASLERSSLRPSGAGNEWNSGTRVPAASSGVADLLPFTSFYNTLYVSPKSLNLAVKHNFSRARNLSCFIELRSTDSLDSSAALKVFYSRPSTRQPPFDSWCNTMVLYHEASPQFNEMFKLCMPLHLTPDHHLLFRFYHVSVDAAGSLTVRDKPLGKKPLESSTGYAWLPILGPNGNINTGTFQLSVASEIQPGYLKLRSSSSRASVPASTSANAAAGDAASASWLEGGKPLFTVQIDSLSSIYTHVPVLARFFRACGELSTHVLNLPSPHATPGGTVKTKTTRVTFREHPVDNQPASADRKRSSISMGTPSAECGRHLCSAIKGLWVIEQSALVHFLPALFNQFMELILISAAAGHRWSLAAASTSPTSPDPNSDSGVTAAWMDFGQPTNVTNVPNEILRTTVGTMAVLISQLNASGSSTRTASPTYTFNVKDIGVSKLDSGGVRHELLKAYVKFAFDPDGLTANCTALQTKTTVPNTQQSPNYRHNPTQLSLPLHHALVRGLILLLADTNCAQHILTHLFANLWFPFALIVKSMSQWLCSSQKIKADRAGDGRFPSAFSNDLALLIKILGSYLNSGGSNRWLLNGLAPTPPVTAPTLSVNSASTSNSVFSAISQSSVNRHSTHSLPVKVPPTNVPGITENGNQRSLTVSSTSTATTGVDSLGRIKTNDGSLPRPGRSTAAQCEFHGLDVMATTARFLSHLFNLMDRGYVMQRVRDLIIFLEILPRMTAEEIDRLNELRFQLLSVLSQHEFFVQLNLPSLGAFHGGSRSPYELSLTEQFRQEHFLVGCILASISCLLAGCVNTGSWATGQSASQLHRQPLVILRNLLAKHSLDPRYATSKPCQARIAALYLPLIRLVLEHPSVIGCPGGALQAAVIAAAARGEFGETAGVMSEARRRKRGTATNDTGNGLGGPSVSRPRSLLSDLSLETLAATGTNHHLIHHTDSVTSLSISNGSAGGGLSGGPNTSGNSSLAGGSSHTSGSIHSAAAYLTEDGKVEKHILDQIAGLNTGGPLRRAQWRRGGAGGGDGGRDGLSSGAPLSCSFSNRSSSETSETSNHHALSSHSGSTTTLTDFVPGRNDGSGDSGHRVNGDLDDDEDDTSSVLVNPITRSRQRDEELDSIRMVDDSHDEVTKDWANQVLALAGVYSQSPKKRPPLPNLSSQVPSSMPSKLNPSSTEASGTHHSTVFTQQLNGRTTSEINGTTVPSTSDQLHQHRPPPGELVAPRRLTDKCQRELFVCVLHILSTVTDDHLTALYHSFTVQERIHFLCLLNYAIQHLRYRGKKCIQQYEHISHSGVGRAGLGPGGSVAGFHSAGRRSTGSLLRSTQGLAMHSSGDSGASSGGNSKDVTLAPNSVAVGENDYTSKVLLEANLATEAGLIILDLLNTFASVFKHQLESCKPSDPVFTGILEVYVALLTNNPSDYLLQHTYAALRMFIGRFAKVLFSESTEILNALCLVGLRCVNQFHPTPPAAFRRDHSQPVPPATSQNNPQLPNSRLLTRGQRAEVQSSSSTGPPVPLNPINQLRMEACGLVYKLWKSSFETYGRTGFHRVHLQTIISVSKLVSEIGPLFEASLSLLNTLVETDMRRFGAETNSTGADTKFWAAADTRALFLEEVNDLIRRIRTVLTATSEMRQHNDDQERLIDLHYCLAKSYSSNPALRRTWLEELAKLHMASKSLAELAMAKLHTAALMAEYLKRRGEFPQGCEAFSSITSNIFQEENGLRTDSALLEIPYTPDDLLIDINEAAVTLEAAGLFEAIRPVYALVLPVYEARQDYSTLAQVYRHIGRAYESIGRAEASGHRLFAAYFRVTFYGHQFESLSNKSFIYRTNACQKLSGMCNELLALYRNQYGQDSVDLLTDYAYNRDAVDPAKAYIQVTYVEPYKGPNRSGRPITSYEKHHDVRQFMFETPFLLQPGMSATASLLAVGPRRSDDLTQQWKRRTVLTTAGTFPHLRRRLEVDQVTETDLCPIDAAIDAIECKNQELMSHISSVQVVTPPVSDVPNGSGDHCTHQRVSVATIGLQSPITGAEVWSSPRSGSSPRKAHRIPLLMDMQLQGALLPTVNVGPMAYAEAFLKAENQVLYPQDKVARLRDLFFEFLTICLVLLTRYHRLMSSVHEAKYAAMRQALDRYRVDLSNLLKEEIVIDENKLVIGPKSVTVDNVSYMPSTMESSMIRDHTI